MYKDCVRDAADKFVCTCANSCVYSLHSIVVDSTLTQSWTSVGSVRASKGPKVTLIIIYTEQRIILFRLLIVIIIIIYTFLHSLRYDIFCSYLQIRCADDAEFRRMRAAAYLDSAQM